MEDAGIPDEPKLLETLANADEAAITVAGSPEAATAGLMRYKPQRLRAGTPIPELNLTLADYWSWAYSDIMENVQRGTFAEFLVAVTLGRTNAIRIGWFGYDVDYRAKKIEVKSSAYLQTWPRWQYSKIIFGFQRRGQWDALTGKYSEPCRVADIYVFAHYFEKEVDVANVLDVSKWHFYVARTQALVDRFGESTGSLTLAQIKEAASASHLATGPVFFSELKPTIDAVVDELGIAGPG